MDAMQRHLTQLSRRQFLQISWALSVAALFGQAGLALVKFISPRKIPGAFGGKVNAGNVNEFLVGTVKHVESGRFYISHLEDSTLLAMWHRCTHLGCTVPWNESEGDFHCPCHSSIYNRKGEVISGPAPRPLDTFQIEIVDDEVIVDTSQEFTRNSYDPSQGTQV